MIRRMVFQPPFGFKITKYLSNVSRVSLEARPRVSSLITSQSVPKFLPIISLSSPAMTAKNKCQKDKDYIKNPHPGFYF